MTDTTTPTLDPWGDVLAGWEERPVTASGVRTFVPPGGEHAAAMLTDRGSDPWNAQLQFVKGWGDFRSGQSYALDTTAAMLHVEVPPRPRLPRPPLRALPTSTRGRDRAENAEPQEEPAPLYVDVADVLDGTHKGPVPTRGGRREDGAPLLYAAAVNILFGAPEAGKTLAAGGMAVHELEHDGRVLWIDIDHNGATALVTRLEALGAPRDQLADRTRFRLAIPEDEHAVMAVLQDSVPWAPTLVIVDSIGELLPMFGAKTNDSDDYTGVHRRVLAATARVTGAAVLAIDHEAKSNESRNYGSAGTMAKKRAVDGAMLRVVNVAPFTPGVGGESHLAIVKDRHGSLRSLTQAGKEPTVARFILTGKEEAMNIIFAAPIKPNLFEQQAKLTNLQELLRMDPPPRNVADVKRHLKWGSDKAAAALREYRQFMRNPADELLDDDD